MEKILNIDGRNVKFKSTGAYLLRYKAQFKRDAIQDIFKMANAIDKETNEITNIELLDLDIFFNLIWVLAKTADPSIDPPLEWLDTFSEFPLMEIIPQVTDMIFGSLAPSIESKKKL